MTDKNEAPCLVDTARGVSVLYNNRYLYSRFDPQKTFVSLLESTTILDESLILCLSPVLSFPIQAIFKKLLEDKVENCFVLAVETDKVLYDFFHSQIHGSVLHENFSSLYAQNESDVSLLLEGLQISSVIQGKGVPNVSSFRRVIIFEASGNVQQHKNFYDSMVRFTQNSISQFWKNRMTLVRLGKLFSINTIKNISALQNSVILEKACVEKPIVVVAAGTSLDALIPFLKQINNTVYVLAIAASIQPLLTQGIRIDGIISLEGQYATDRAFIGFDKIDIPLFTDLASRPNILKKFKNVSLFLSEYTKNPLLERIKHTFLDIPVFPPLGSVGITATELALFLRKREDVPVFICGLDFAFPIGKTHGNETPHIKEALNVSNKLSPVGSPAMSFRHGTFKLKDPTKISDAGLKVYADLFNERYKNTKNLYDLSHFGMLTDIKTCSLENCMVMIQSFENKEDIHTFSTRIDSKNVAKFYKEEKEKLVAIKDMLTGKSTFDDTRLIDLLNECSYLFMHFPDGHKGANLRQDFLNRVRGEVDVFLKTTEVAMYDKGVRGR